LPRRKVRSPGELELEPEPEARATAQDLKAEADLAEAELKPEEGLEPGPELEAEAATTPLGTCKRSSIVREGREVGL
jgi:hypothetical protein